MKLFVLISTTVAAMALFAAVAMADAPSPVASATTGTVTYNSDGTRTVTLQGQWTWSTGGCTGGNAAGYAIDWGDNTANPITHNGTTIYVGDATDNTVHPAGCGTSGNWGPIQHTYAAGTGAVVVCPVLYHTKTGTTTGSHSTIAGGSHHNGDNSFENGEGCTSAPSSRTLPTLTTQASSGAAAGTPINDTATLGGGNTPTGTITWQLFDNSSCSGSPAPSSATVSGNGNYVSPGATPAAGTYYWVATYSGDANNLAVTTACGDPAEKVVVTPAGTSPTTGGAGGTNGTNTNVQVTPNLISTSSKKCVDRRKFKFRLHRFRNARITEVTVFVNKKRRKHLTGTDIRTVTIKRLPLGTFTIKIIAVQSTGSTLTSTRKYKGCKKSKPHTVGHHVHPHH